MTSVCRVFFTKILYFSYCMFISLTCVIHTSAFSSKVLITLSHAEDTDSVRNIVERYGFKYSRQILPTVHEYEPITANLTKKILKEIKRNGQGYISHMYVDDKIILPVGKPKNKLSQFLKHFQKRSLRDMLVCSPYYGMDIMTAWGLGFRGQGVTVGVVDTGVEVSHIDLAPNINITLSRNFVNGQSETDVSPDILPSYQELDIFSDHGNNCAGLIAAVQGNRVCSSGVAPDATIAVLKVLEMKDPSQSTEVISYRPAELIEALVYRNDQIDVYSNSYGPGEDFAKSSVVFNEAFKIGTTEGRGGKGSIFVVATGNKGHHKDANLDGYVNSIYTIAINSLGVNGTIPKFAQPGACIIASTYGEGLNKFDQHLVTTSHGNSCTDEFKRTSASAAIASGIIALVIQANNDLTWRDIQHLIINTSSIADLEGHTKVVTNSAGYTYHPFFGFGLMNASALVITAKSWIIVPEQKVIQASATIRESSKAKPIHSVSVNVCQESSPCLGFTEHVVAYIEYISYHDKLVEFQLCAPTNTCSILLTRQYVRQHLPRKRITRKWKFMSLQFWGEAPRGIWVLNMLQSPSGISLKDKQFTITGINLTVYGHSDMTHEPSLYEEIEEYTSKTIEDIAEALDVEISEENKVKIEHIVFTIGEIVFGTVSIILVLTFWCFDREESDLHIRQTCQQVWTFIRNICRALCRRIRQVYDPVNVNDDEDQ